MLSHLKSREDWNERSLGAKGFTLIELLIVIIILGILAAVVVLGVNSLKGGSVKAACQTEVKTVEAAAAAYASDNNGTFPAAISDLTGGTYLKSKPKYIDGINTANGNPQAGGSDLDYTQCTNNQATVS